MELFLNDPRDPIEYNPVFREYFIRLNNCSNIITLTYCPWCSSKLPTSLRESYFDILEKEYQIETNLGEYKERSDIPSDFKTDRWWKTREEKNARYSGKEFNVERR